MAREGQIEIKSPEMVGDLVTANYDEFCTQLSNSIDEHTKGI